MAKVISINDTRYEHVVIDSEYFFVDRDAISVDNRVYFGVLPTYDSRDKTIAIRRVENESVRKDVLNILQKLVEHDEER